MAGKPTHQEAREILGSAPVAGAFEQKQGQIDGQQARSDALAARISAAESDNAAQDGRLDDHVGRFATVNTRLANLENRVTAAENTNDAQGTVLSNHSSSIADLRTDVNLVKDQNVSQSNSISALRTDVNALEAFRNRPNGFAFAPNNQTVDHTH